jgi:hypothetical protein
VSRQKIMAKFFARRDQAWKVRCATLAAEQQLGAVTPARELEIQGVYSKELHAAHAEWNEQWIADRQPGDM